MRTGSGAFEFPNRRNANAPSTIATTMIIVMIFLS
jgi:hypothetical protein